MTAMLPRPVACRAGHRKTGRALYEAGLAHGGRMTDYAAFLRDPDRNKVEVVTFAGD